MTLPATLAPTRTMDFEHPRVAQFVRETVGNATEPREKAVRLFYAVRDGLRYDPYQFRLEEEWLSASRTLENGHGWCVPKAILLTACYRAAGIRARVGFADVQNHLATKRLLELMGTDVFVWHGYTGLELDGRWIKVTPAFNIEMCERFGVKPLEFDGHTDALMHSFNVRNERHMQYLQDHGQFDDVPHARMVAAMHQRYPKLIGAALGADGARFEQDSIHTG